MRSKHRKNRQPICQSKCKPRWRICFPGLADLFVTTGSSGWYCAKLRLAAFRPMPISLTRGRSGFHTGQHDQWWPQHRPKFTRRNDPTSLRFVTGYEPDFNRGIIETSQSNSRLYHGKLQRFRILSINRKIQYGFIAGPKARLDHSTAGHYD